MVKNTMTTSSLSVLLTKLVIVLSLLVCSINGQSPFRYSCNVCGNGNIILYPGKRFLYRIRPIIRTRQYRNCARHYFGNIYRGAKNEATCTKFQNDKNMIDICGCTKPFDGNTTSVVVP